jgi:hypothetical protein
VVHAYHAKELAAPLYFPSQHALPATTVGGAGEPAPEELAASMRDHAEFEQAYRGQAEEFLQGLLDEVQEPVGGSRCSRRWWTTSTRPRRWLTCRPMLNCWWSDHGAMGGFGELLLGSVSHAVVLHAVRPVVVVPSPRDERRTRPPRQ